MIAIPRLGLLCLALLWQGAAQGSSPLWLSDTPPMAGHSGGHSHGGPVQVRRGVYYKSLWLRQGDTPQEAGYVERGSHFSPLLLLDTAGKLSEQPLRRDRSHGLLNTEFAMPEEGFYNAYLIHQWVDAGLREVQIAKAEVLKHSCREGHDHVQEKMPARHSGNIALEIVRERQPKENFHSRLAFGDKIAFLVLRNGKPQAGANVTFHTAQGWNKSAVSDGTGRVSFEVIRDYFPQWHLFNKRHAQSYLVSAQLGVPEAGELDGDHYDTTLYRASYAGSYYPSERDYASYGYGLLLGTFALVFSGLAIYLYRRRRNRPYREVHFDE